MNVTQVFPPIMLDCAEFVITDVSSDSEKCKAIFVCLYLSPNAATKVENIEQIYQMLAFCVNANFPTFILGDFNLPYIDWGIPVSHGGLNHQDFVKFCINNSLTQIIDDPTHCDGNILDLLLCNNFSVQFTIASCWHSLVQFL